MSANNQCKENEEIDEVLEEDDWTRGRSPCLGDPSSVHWGCMSTLKLELVEPLSASSRT